MLCTKLPLIIKATKISECHQTTAGSGHTVPKRKSYIDLEQWDHENHLLCTHSDWLHIPGIFPTAADLISSACMSLYFSFPIKPPQVP